jgi:hypothetical protein
MSEQKLAGDAKGRDEIIVAGGKVAAIHALALSRCGTLPVSELAMIAAHLRDVACIAEELGDAGAAADLRRDADKLEAL